jgi:hypothetical protein
MNESLRNYKNESSIAKTKIFLSHKHDEEEQLEGAISFLKTFGVDIYLDWLDEGMPQNTSGTTAARIKQKIRENHKFILLATEGAINSKWCNWELGLGDAAKFIEHIAVFPIKNDFSDYSGNEYLEIYPNVFNLNSDQYLNGTLRRKGTYIVYPPINGIIKVVSIAEWLRNR